MRVKPKFVEWDEIYRAFLDAKVHKTGSRDYKKFCRDLVENLKRLQNDINDGTYLPGKSTCFVVTKPKPREVFAADFRDRVVHHLIIKHLMPCFENTFIANSFSCMDGRGTYKGVLELHKAMKEHPKGWVAKFDIKGFFMHIQKDRLNIMVENFVKLWFEKTDPELCALLLYLCRVTVLHHPELNCVLHSPKHLWNRIEDSKSLFKIDENLGLAIGNLTSQLFAGLYLNSFDYYMASKFRCYGRYVDDFYIVTDTKEEILREIKGIEEELAKIGLELHKDKRYIQPVSHGCKFIGSMVYSNRLYTGNGTISNMYKAVHRFNMMECDKDNLVQIIRSLNSYLGFLKHFKEYRNRMKLWNMLDPKWKVYIGIRKDYSVIYLKYPYKILNIVDRYGNLPERSNGDYSRWLGRFYWDPPVQHIDPLQEQRGFMY